MYINVCPVLSAVALPNQPITVTLVLDQYLTILEEKEEGQSLAMAC